MTDADQPVYTGQCFCGAVCIEATGAPFAMGYCHCADCRAWAAAPVNGYTLWSPGSVTVTKGEHLLGKYKKTERSLRHYCTECGGHLLTDHPNDDFTDVYSAILPDLHFQPTMHVQCDSSVMHIDDGLPKYRDFPVEFGGSGEQIP